MDEPVMSTNDDAATCKRYAIQLGYWEDAFLPYFVKSAERKAPEINRGYYARVKGIKYLITQFIKATDGNCQIASLGAGFDTLYWRLRSEGIHIKSYVEVDLPGVTSRKVYYIRHRKPLLNGMVNEDEDIKFSSSDLHAGGYHLLGADMRHIDEVKSKVKEYLDVSIPTAFLAECVLVYLPVPQSSTLLKWIADDFENAVFFNYEQVNMTDRFGEIMVENLKKRCCNLEGVTVCASLKTQEERFLSQGWTFAKSYDMQEVYNSLDRDDVSRVEKLEFLDECELLQQLLQHYCVTVAIKGKQIPADEVCFETS